MLLATEFGEFNSARTNAHQPGEKTPRASLAEPRQLTPLQENRKMTRRISSQEEFVAIKPNFPSASDPNFRKFKKNYFFNSESRIELTGAPREQVLRDKSGDRWDIFGEFRDGKTVAEFFQAAKEITSRAERDHDMFIALRKGYIRLIPDGKGTELRK